MIQIEKKIDGLIETIEIAENWDEVFYISYVNLLKDKVLIIENDYERTIKTLSCVSSNKEKCENWLREMSVEQFGELIKMFSFISFDKLETVKKEYIEVDKRKFKIRQDHNEIKWGNQVKFELLKDQYKNTEDYVLALGVILAEIDENGKEMDFDLKTFDYCVNIIPEKVKMIDLYQHVDFFLSGEKRQYLKTSEKFTIRKIT